MLMDSHVTVSKPISSTVKNRCAVQSVTARTTTAASGVMTLSSRSYTPGKGLAISRQRMPTSRMAQR